LSEDEFVSQTNKVMAECDRSIHLMDGEYGSVPEGWRRSMAENQIQCAAQARDRNFRALVWQDREAAPDVRQSGLIEELRTKLRSSGPVDLITQGMEYLLSNFRDILDRPDAARAVEDYRIPAGRSVYVQCTRQDLDQLESTFRELTSRGIPAIRDFIQTECNSGAGIDQLRAAIVRETDRMEHLRDSFPSSWFNVKETLANLHDERDFISFQRYRELCTRQGIGDTSAQETLVAFLHDLGIVVNFRDDPRLAEMLILKPEWVTNGIYKIVNSDILMQKRGELELADLEGVLPARRYPRQMHLFLLELMSKFELCYEYSERPGTYLIPELLGKEEPDLAAYEESGALEFRYRYDILPEGLLARFIVRSRALNEDKVYWRNGVVLRWQDNTAVVKADMLDRLVTIRVIGPPERRRRLLAVIQADFEHLHRSMALRVEAEVPVPGYTGLAVPYQTLVVMQAEGEAFIPLVHGDRMVRVSVDSLLVGVEEDQRARGAEPARGGAAPVRLALSYAHQDEELRDRLATYLKLLERQGMIRSWHDRKVMPGQEWKEAIDESFRQADLILLLVSANFLSSDYCYEGEMRMMLERHEKGEARVVPVILRPCDWRNSPFGRLQALPKGGWPVTSWGKRDEAWNDVAMGIRRAAEGIRRGG
jgi:internalin A